MKTLETPPQEIPKIKDYFNLELWSLKNNFYVHPAFLKAVKTKQRLLIIFSTLLSSLLTLLLIVLMNLIR